MSSTGTVPPEAPTRACPRCGAGNAGGAVFCASCGGSMTAPPPPPPPPMPPQLPPMRPTGGAGHRVTVAMDADSAYAAAIEALAAAGCEVTWQSPPNAAKFGYVYKSVWNTGGMRVTYAGDLAITPSGPNQSSVSLTLAVNWGSAVGIFVMYLVAGVVFFAMNPAAGMFAMLIAIAGSATSGWHLSSKQPENQARKILQSLGPPVMVVGGLPPQPQPRAAAPRPAAPAPQQPAAPPPKQPAAPPQTPPPADTTSVFDQIKRLAELRDMNAITPEEFEAKKAELLKRL